LIAKDKEIVKVVLFLTGSVEGTKKQVNEYLGEFFKYDFSTATFVCVTASERPTRQELVSYANMVLSNCIQTLHHFTFQT
jgi:hypothetical protein